ncbi:MAG TPA: hypothetical protein VGG98_11170 [Solirubrobacteraceae bacterium]|jgi:hypothetical protein
MKPLKLFSLAIGIILTVIALSSATAAAENPEILPNPTSEKPVTFTSTSEATKLVSVMKKTIACTKGKSEGAFTSAREGTLTIDLEGCALEAAKCNTTGDAAGVILIKSKVTLVDLEKGELVLGEANTPEGVPAKCGVLKAEFRGTVIGEFAGIGTPTPSVVFKQKEGKQTITKCNQTKAFCEGKEYSLEANFGLGFEKAALEATFAITNISPETVFVDF